MQSETRIKIKESRNKYFQELTKKQSLGKVVHGPAKERPASTNAETRNILQLVPPVTFPRIYNPEKVKKGMKVVNTYTGKLSHGVSEMRTAVTDSYVQRTEKMKEQLLSVMLTIFDA